MNDKELLPVIRERLNTLVLPDSEVLLGDFPYRLENLRTDAGKISLVLVLPFPYDSYREQLLTLIALSLGDLTATVTLRCVIDTKKVATGVKTLTAIKNIVVVGSGKGGVGKSTVAANVALALKKMGAAVGLLDADLYGPSQTLMLGARGQKAGNSGGQFIPWHNEDGLEVMSIGLLIEENQAVVWRGPMVSRVLQQLLLQTKWSSLDYLIIDLPPGTGDIQLTMAQKIPITAALIVTTPQEVALIDARKAIDMFRKVNIPVLGIVENMSVYICARCGDREAIFGSHGAFKLAEETAAPILAEIPLAMPIRQAMDAGRQNLLGEYGLYYQQTAWRLALGLAKLSKDYSHRFPEIILE